MKIITKSREHLDYSNTMYPSHGMLYESESEQDQVSVLPCSTMYGYVFSGVVNLPNGMVAKEGQYFSCWTWRKGVINYMGKFASFERVGFCGQDMVGGPIEKSGRLVYIDGCSDSLLVYPPRLGDPSLNALFFNPHINQTYHIHPSIRLGAVVSGKGWACLKNPDGSENRIALEPGMVFCIEEREIHRFVTVYEPMVVVAYHPDGDWGPTDHNHTMLNRTYVTK